jgi:predicted dehydrogenase
MRFGVVGLGIGRFHAEAIRLAGNRIAALCDSSPERLKEFLEKHKTARGYTSVDDMLSRENLDVVIVATPNKTHCPLALKALKAGAHVYCEKPMATSVAECRLMETAAKKARRRLMIGFSYRFSPVSQALRKVVDSGKLGRLYAGRTFWRRCNGIPGLGGWFTTKALSGGGPIIDLGVHRLDLALWYLGHPEPASVSASTFDFLGRQEAKRQGKTMDVEDLGQALVRFKDGRTLLVEASWKTPGCLGQDMETTLYGTQGGLTHRNREGGYKMEGLYFLQARDGNYQTFPAKPAPAQNALVHFAKAIESGKPHQCQPWEGIVVQKILDGIYESARKRAPVKVG